MKKTLFHEPATRALILLVLINTIILTGFVDISGSSSHSSVKYESSPIKENEISIQDLEGSTDELINKQLDEYPIAGITLSIVKDGKIALAKGYGYANVKEQLPVSPEETIFRIGSTSKLFTWTAVMQLAEQGKIDLNADVNTYLPDFQIPATYPQPITMVNLLAHNAGFEERATGTESSGPDEMISLHDYLKEYTPDRVRPAGELSTYSNYGAALAGYIVEAVSGMPFEQYIETNIFDPLSMTHSTFRQPLPAVLAGHLAKSYAYNVAFLEKPFQYPNLLPAASMNSTAKDMANFILANLQQGKLGSGQMLKPESVALMHSHLFSADDRLDGFAYGFIEETVNDRRVLWHGGDIGCWHSVLAIVPEENLGFFIGTNSDEGLQAINEAYYAILNAYLPAQATSAPSIIEITSADPINLSGEYHGTRSFYNHIEKAADFPGKNHFRVTQNSSQSISIGGQIFYQVEPLVYASEDGKTTYVFHQAGKSIRMYAGGFPLYAFERLSWYETAMFNTLAFGLCYLLLLTFIVASIIGIFRSHKREGQGSHLPRVARIWSVILSLVFVLLPIAVVFYRQLYLKSPFPLYMQAVLAIILAASVLVAGPVIFTFLAWWRHYWRVAGRLHYTFVTIALLGMVWLTYYWRLLGFRY